MTDLRKTLLGLVLYGCAACAGAQGVPQTRDSPSQQFPARVPKGGVAPILDMRIQDDGITLPKGVQPPQESEPLKAEEKPAAKPAPDTSGNKSSR